MTQAISASCHVYSLSAESKKDRVGEFSSASSNAVLIRDCGARTDTLIVLSRFGRLEEEEDDDDEEDEAEKDEEDNDDDDAGVDV